MLPVGMRGYGTMVWYERGLWVFHTKCFAGTPFADYLLGRFFVKVEWEFKPD